MQPDDAITRQVKLFNSTNPYQLTFYKRLIKEIGHYNLIFRNFFGIFQKKFNKVLWVQIIEIIKLYNNRDIRIQTHIPFRDAQK